MYEMEGPRASPAAPTGDRSPAPRPGDGSRSGPPALVAQLLRCFPVGPLRLPPEEPRFADPVDLLRRLPEETR